MTVNIKYPIESFTFLFFNIKSQKKMISRTLLSSKKFGTLKIKLYLLKIELLIVVSI